MKLAIGIASNEQYFSSDYTINLLGLTSPERIAELKDFGITEHAILYNPSYPIDLARNQIIRRSIEVGADYLIFLDPEILYPKNIFLELLEKDADIISPLYFKKDPPHAAAAAFRQQDDVQLLMPLLEWGDSPVEVDVVGCGGMLIKRKVLDAIADPWFTFETYDRTGESIVSEDAVFCRKVQEAGFKVFVDPATKCGRVSRRIVEEQDWFNYRDRVREYAYVNMAKALRGPME